MECVWVDSGVCEGEQWNVCGVGSGVCGGWAVKCVCGWTVECVCGWTVECVVGSRLPKWRIILNCG